METLFKPTQLSWRDDTPYSTQYGDIYFHQEDGIGESEYVFLKGNHLPEAWKGRAFTIAETGFGTGLNFLISLAAGRQVPWQKLTYVSVENHPLTPEDLHRCHQLLPSLSKEARALQDVYPPLTPGIHHLDLPEYRCTLILLFGPLAKMAEHLPKGVNAWFLDGFAPSRNPAMWTAALFQRMADHAAPGAGFATFTAAGFVRRGLQEVGFQVERIPGFRKRNMLRGIRSQ